MTLLSVSLQKRSKFTKLHWRLLAARFTLLNHAEFGAPAYRPRGRGSDRENAGLEKMGRGNRHHSTSCALKDKNVRFCKDTLLARFAGEWALQKGIGNLGQRMPLAAGITVGCLVERRPDLAPGLNPTPSEAK